VEIEEITAGQPIRVGDITLVPIFRTFVSCDGCEAGIVGHGSKRPTGIAIASQGQQYVMDLGGKKMLIEPFHEQVTGLAELLA
jgi:hypothetical protein